MPDVQIANRDWYSNFPRLLQFAIRQSNSESPNRAMPSDRAIRATSRRWGMIDGSRRNSPPIDPDPIAFPRPPPMSMPTAVRHTLAAADPGRLFVEFAGHQRRRAGPAARRTRRRPRPRSPAATRTTPSGSRGTTARGGPRLRPGPHRRDARLPRRGLHHPADDPGDRRLRRPRHPRRASRPARLGDRPDRGAGPGAT